MIHKTPRALSGSSDGLDGISKSWKLEKKEASLSGFAVLGDMIDVIKEPTSQIVIAFSNANNNEDTIDTATINLYGLQNFSILR